MILENMYVQNNKTPGTLCGKNCFRKAFGDICRLCSAAKVAERKGNPQGLKGLYDETMKSIYSDMDNLIHYAYEQMLEREQTVLYTWSE